MKWIRSLCVRLVAVLAVLVWVLSLSAPYLIKRYVTSHYSGASVESVEISYILRDVALRDVKIERPNFHAELPFVEVDFNKDVIVRGGLVRLLLDEEATRSASALGVGAGTVTGRLSSVRVLGRNLAAELTGVSFDAKEVCFEHGSVQYLTYSAEIQDACIKRDKSFARARSAVISGTLPFAIPTLSHEQKVSIFEIELEPKRVRFNTAIAPWFTVHGPATLERTDTTISFESPKIFVNHVWLAPSPVTFNKVSVTAPSNLLGGQGKVELSLGDAHIHLDLTNRDLSGAESCATWFDAFPKPLPKAMQGVADHFSGSLSFEVRVKPTPKVELKSTCHFECNASPIREILGSKFTYARLGSNGILVDREIGPMSPDWVPLNEIPTAASRAFVLLEDPGFSMHQGVQAKALENSLKIDVENGGFVRGGSTITMQLARNLWLYRYKSLGRKAEEALLAYAMESCLTKERILEMYLNVIEFGPDVYGIGPATRYYFHKEASDLLPEEAFYLASILPAPLHAIPPKQGGLVRIHRIMQSLAASGLISEYLVPGDSPVSTSGWDTAN